MIKSISLFSGCMGFDIGLEQSGIETLCYCDKDAVCRETIKANRPNAMIVNDVFSEEILKFTNVDLVVGGPPCQSFSTIGKRKFLEDDRGFALIGFVEVVEKIKPLIFVLENVTGLLSAKNGEIVSYITKRFENSGYKLKYDILDTSLYGIPQIRKRFFMIGMLEKMPYLPIPTNKNVTLRDAICELEENPGEFIPFTKKMFEVMEKIPEGGCWRNLSDEDKKIAMGNANLKSGGLTSFYRRLNYDRPSPTLLTSPAQRATTLCHPKKTRPLSVMEYRKIQCFPDDWKICGNVMDKYRQIGNAIPVKMGKIFGELIKTLF